MKKIRFSRFPHIGVGVLLIKDGKVLLGCRKGKRSPGYFGLPGGYLINDESFEACARREVFEETGLNLTSIYPFCLLSVRTTSCHYIDMIFWTEIADQEPIIREPNRVESWQWFDFSNLPSPLYTPSDHALRQFINSRGLPNSNFFQNNLVFKKKGGIFFLDIYDKLE